MEDKKIDKIKLLELFFLLFEARVNIIEIKDNTIRGFVIWEAEEETQEFLWKIPRENMDIRSIGKLIKFIVDRNLNKGDCIIISEEELSSLLKKNKWEIKTIGESIRKLKEIKIHMIDEGEITDYFFIHF